MLALLSRCLPRAAKQHLFGAFVAWRTWTNPLLVPLGNALSELDMALRPRHHAARLDAAIGAGIAWFARREAWEFDAVWLLGRVVDVRDEPALVVAEQAYQAYRSAWRDRYLRLFDPTYHEDVHGASRLKMPWRPDPIHKMMRKVLHADRLGLREPFLDQLCALEDGGSYGTTHVLVGAHYLRQFSAIAPAALDRVVASCIPTLLRRQRVDRIGDIYAERVVVLQLIGRHDLVRPAWIARMVRGQQRDGGWYYKVPPLRVTSEQHPSALALAALIRYRSQRRLPRADSPSPHGAPP